MKEFDILYKKIKRYLKKNSKILDRIFEKLSICIQIPAPL